MTAIRMRLRFDYPGYGKTGKVFAKKSVEQNAEETRQHKVALLRNVPYQGIRIEDIDMSSEVYTVYDDISRKEIAYAPVVITISADSVEDAIKFSMKDEFRTVEVLEPEIINLSRAEIERVLYKASEELRSYKEYILKRINNWN
jgi:rubrerythrin